MLTTEVLFNYNLGYYDILNINYFGTTYKELLKSTFTYSQPFTIKRKWPVIPSAHKIIITPE